MINNIVIFDPAETAGGAFSRAVELATELPEFHYCFVTYKPFDYLHSGMRPPHCKTLRLFSFISPTQANYLYKGLDKTFRSKILARSFSFFVSALLKINKISLQLQARIGLAGHGIDLVQANNGIHFLPYFLSKLKQAPLIYYFRDLQYFAHCPPHFLSEAARLIFVGQKLMEQYEKQLPLPREKCQVIHSPFDVYKRLQFEDHDNLDWLQQLKRNGKKVIVCNSRICLEKGQHVIIEAMKHLIITQPDLLLLIVGAAAKTRNDQEYLRKLKRQVEEYQLSDKVIFLGHRNDPLHILQYANIAVQAPTYFEALAGSLVEAVQLGIPTISSDIGGASEVLIEGKTGFLFPPEDSMALAGIVNHILCSPEDIAPIIEQGKIHAIQHWSPAKMSKQMQAIYSIARNNQ